MHLVRRCPSRQTHSAAARRARLQTFSTAGDRGRLQAVEVHPEVDDALANGKPVVALESTIITHGMPHPVNLDTARDVENIVRSTGAIPATIGIIRGRVKIGLEPSELEYLAGPDSTAVKVSRRDIAPSIALQRDGGTTCSATLIFADMTGIKVFATGGLGGVHRGGENSMDVSADLQELTRCPVGLVSAGVKSILDIGRTLEYLETLGVPVVTYGPTDDFPAFYSRHSGWKSPWRIEDPVTAARILHTQHSLSMKNGVLFGVPIPEEYEAIGQELQQYVEQAVKEADNLGISNRGKEVTPWLLKRVGKLTQGKSLANNVALIKNTALVGGKIAVEYARLASANRNEAYQPMIATTPAKSSAVQADHAAVSMTETTKARAKLVVIGSSAVDVTAQAAQIGSPALGQHSTVPGKVSLSLGGVARNVAEAAHRILTAESSHMSDATVIISAVGKDLFGRLLVEETDRMGMRIDGFLPVDNARSAVCNMVLDSEGSLIGGVADMNVVDSLDMTEVNEVLNKHEPSIVAFDANLSPTSLKGLIKHCNERSIPVFFEPTSVPKSTNIFPAVAAQLSYQEQPPIAFAAPNLLELAHMYQAARNSPEELTNHKRWWKAIDDMALGSEFRVDLEQLGRRNACDTDATKGTLSFIIESGVAQMAIHLLPFIQHLIIKCGDRGVITVYHLIGDSARRSALSQERTNIHGRCVVAKSKSGDVVVVKHFPANTVSRDDIINVTGAGDTLVGSILASLVRQPKAFEDPHMLDDLVANAQRAAVLTLQSHLAVSPELSSSSRTTS